jgi:hypothetical protein
MCLFGRRKKQEKLTRQQRRKLQRDVAKLEKRVRRKAEHTLNNSHIPKWIRDVKRSQLERSGFLTGTIKTKQYV